LNPQGRTPRDRHAAGYPPAAADRALRADAAAVATIAAALALLFAWPLAAGSHSFLMFGDAQEQTYAWFQKLAYSIEQGYLPLWNANSTGGHDFAGEIQTAVMYPLNWAWVWLHAADGSISALAIDFLIALQFLIAALGMYGLLRRWQLGAGAALFGALSFVLFGPFAMRASAQANILAGLALMPWAVLAATVHFERGRQRWAMLTGALVGLQVLAGHVQPAVHTAMLIGLIAFLRRDSDGSAKPALRTLASGTWMALAACVVALPQILITSGYLAEAYRWIGGADPLAPGKRVPWRIFGFEHILEPKSLLSAIDPWRFGASDGNALYVGMLGLAMAAWFLASPERRRALPAWRAHGRALLVAAAFALVCVLGHYTWVSTLLRQIPVIGQIRQLGRYAILFHFAVACLAGFALHSLLERPPRAWRPRLDALKAIAAVFLILQLVWLWIHDGLLSPPATQSLWLSLAFGLVVALGNNRRSVVLVAALAVLLAQAWIFRDLVLPRVDGATTAEAAFAARPMLSALESSYGRERVLIDESAGLPRNYGLPRRWQTKHGYGATMHRSYYDFIIRDWGIDTPENDLLGVRWVVARADLPLRLIGREAAGGLSLYERDSWYPRVFLRTQHGSSPRGKALERAIGLEVLHYDDRLQRFRIDSQGDDVAVVTELNYRGWCARVNGAAVSIAPVQLDGLQTPFRSVPVRAGRNELEFEYRPFASLLFGCD